MFRNRRFRYIYFIATIVYLAVGLVLGILVLHKPLLLVILGEIVIFLACVIGAMLSWLVIREINPRLRRDTKPKDKNRFKR